MSDEWVPNDLFMMIGIIEPKEQAWKRSGKPKLLQAAADKIALRPFTSFGNKNSEEDENPRSFIVVTVIESVIASIEPYISRARTISGKAQPF